MPTLRRQPADISLYMDQGIYIVGKELKRLQELQRAQGLSPDECGSLVAMLRVMALVKREAMDAAAEVGGEADLSSFTEDELRERFERLYESRAVGPTQNAHTGPLDGTNGPVGPMPPPKADE